MTPENQQRIEKATAELKEAFFNKLPVKFKKLHPYAVVPTRATVGSAGWDLTTIGFSDVKNEFFNNKFNHPDLIRYHTGIAVEIPSGYVGLLFPRSSCYKKHISLTNSVGVIDSDYRGEICFIYREIDDLHDEYNKGDRIGQLVIVPCPDVEMVEVDELSRTERGQGGFGSTGK